MRLLTVIFGLIAIAQYFERGYIDWLGLATMLLLAIPAAITLKGVK